MPRSAPATPLPQPHRAIGTPPTSEDRWLVTGGAGYIGSHVVRALQAYGARVVVLDDLSTGRAERVEGIPLITSSIVAEPQAISRVLREFDITGIIHVAAKKAVGESVDRPVHYYEQNVLGTMRLMEAAAACGISKVIYSSSAAVYGRAPTERAVTEDDRPAPGNPYGETKLAAEWAVRSIAEAHGMAWTALRYFNVAGAASSVLADRGTSNLLPRALARVFAGLPVDVYGADWPTADGSCVRDYVHVEDIADAHLAAVRGMASGAGAGVLNVGRGVGVSVFEMLDAIARHTGLPVRREIEPRRAGDVAAVVADVSRIRERLGWQARHDLDDIVGSSVRAALALGLPALHASPA